MRNITFGGVLYCGYKRIRGNEALRKVKINISNEYEGDDKLLPMRTQILEYQDGFFTVYGEIDIYSRPAMKFEPVLIIEYPCEIDPEEPSTVHSFMFPEMSGGTIFDIGIVNLKMFFYFWHKRFRDYRYDFE
ncbi:unnamed protein product [Dracunculus medinensis]|uniref:Transthyretin-like family protein n=1 Tax=Dracunculus medinensis TaxID=318479 RepID=A0A0N4UA55_DRAME|nr:unnamed protein product [Dracunculus medinensis]